jgi:hypothetical protein
MFIYSNGQFLTVHLQDAGYAQGGFQAGYGGSTMQAQVHDRALMVQVAPDAAQQAQYHNQMADLQVLAARHAADGYWSGQALPVDLARLQALWNQAQRPELEKNAARVLYLLLAARNRNVHLDVTSIAAGLLRSTWEVLSALALLHTYGAVRFGNGQVPNPADTSGWQGAAPVALASDPPDLSRLGPFADCLWRTGEVLTAR